MKIIKFDISFYLILILSFLCGYFKSILILYLIIIIHELGHIFFIKLFNKDIISIKLYAFGGISKYNSLVNHNIFSELLISLGGILNQLLLFIIFYILYKYSLISNNTYNLFINNNISLIIFNLIPMIGLDGEKIIHLILEYIYPYKLVNRIMIIISIISLLLFIINCINLKINIIYIIVFLIYRLINYIKSIRYVENKFYLERYLYDISYRNIKYLNNSDISNMYQDTYHFFNNNSEYKVLKKRFE